MRVQASEITARQAEKLLKIVPKQEIRLLKMQRKLVMTKLRMLYVYGMSQELLIKKKRMRIAEANRQYNSTVSTARDKHKKLWVKQNPKLGNMQIKLIGKLVR